MAGNWDAVTSGDMKEEAEALIDGTEEIKEVGSMSETEVVGLPIEREVLGFVVAAVVGKVMGIEGFVENAELSITIGAMVGNIDASTCTVLTFIVG